MKTMIKWGWTDDYGTIWKAEYKWTETRAEADEWVAEMVNRNGGWFKVVTIKEANYEKWLRIAELEKELAELRKEF